MPKQCAAALPPSGSATTAQPSGPHSSSLAGSAALAAVPLRDRSPSISSCRVQGGGGGSLGGQTLDLLRCPRSASAAHTATQPDMPKPHTKNTATPCLHDVCQVKFFLNRHLLLCRRAARGPRHQRPTGQGLQRGGAHLAAQQAVQPLLDGVLFGRQQNEFSCERIGKHDGGTDQTVARARCTLSRFARVPRLVPCIRPSSFRAYCEPA